MPVHKAIAMLINPESLPSLRELCIMTRFSQDPEQRPETYMLSLISSRQPNLKRAFFSDPEHLVSCEPHLSTEDEEQVDAGTPQLRNVHTYTIAPTWAFDRWPRRTLYSNSTLAPFFDADFPIPLSAEKHPMVFNHV